ncbi:Zn-ribbon domain-containing OB-fold protein [Ferroglobus sp.]|uniref:Zn-ribbon domain-containing OB-fold protein n=1 Tax=Ferroglobus sp. TaxID=2614230 RepID=UPI0025C6F361|nr:Zn-ribbon domain-containing OB-fold protein [Ferroglobus sp.]
MLPRFWRKIKYRYRLVGSYCENCGEYYHPPRNLCPKCRRKGSIKEVPLGSEGTILSYTVVHDAPDDFKLQKPYVVGLVKLDCGAVVTAQICCKPEEVEIGRRVRAVFRKYSEEGEDGIIYYGTKFELI